MKNILLFDYDGTIVDSERLVHKAFNKAAKQYGLPQVKTSKDFKKLYNKNVYESILESGLPKNKLKEFFDAWRDAYLKPYLQIRAFKGINRVLNILSRTSTIIVITSNSIKAVKLSIDRLNIEGISEILGGENGISKVDKILNIKKRFPNSKLYYIGDTAGDIIEGRKAGVGTISVTWGVHSHAHLKKYVPDFIVEKPEELLEILR